MEGARVWLVPDGYLPAASSGEQVSHEAVCVLNTGGQDAHLKLAVYFEDRPPVTGIAVTVGAERTRHVRLDRPEELGGAAIPRGVPYALRVESDVPVTVQHSRMDTSQAALTLMTTMAFPVG
ncbi:MAG: Anabaena sensory rhodopsin transducer [uncultured Thermomicrobiales bacterium]|uniref:Sensory rhodopsin transducer n=1 Tax=uncultured Thermomicrobiales bacterium TaxID=1645740 RepID=A0A6J4USB7_9BACT|nr:MAG: Anabaena sensory rhodopsin transducer [uncultured Thermomicrobiales bacterium]